MDDTEKSTETKSPHNVNGSECSALLYSGEGYYCTACECLCETYEQGLSCSCGDPWETEVCDPDYYPDKWVRVKVEARRI